jgi:Glu-tRNA(Gln) amidotransferase subunit E-like FAD-binding protein
LVARRPVLWEAWREIVTRIGVAPGIDIKLVVEEAGLAGAVPELEPRLKRAVRYGLDHCNGTSVQELVRCCMGQVMPELRGRVAAKEVRAALQKKLQQFV